MELLGSGYRGFPGCQPDLGIISALQDFLLTQRVCKGRNSHLRKPVKFDIWEASMVPNISEIRSHEELHWQQQRWFLLALEHS